MACLSAVLNPSGEPVTSCVLCILSSRLESSVSGSVAFGSPSMSSCLDCFGGESESMVSLFSACLGMTADSAVSESDSGSEEDEVSVSSEESEEDSERFVSFEAD